MVRQVVVYTCVRLVTRVGSDRHPVYGGPWPRVRRAILERDGNKCQIRLPCCTTKATCVDHITPVLDGGAWYDPANLRAACAPCNNRLVRRGAKPPPAPPSRHWL